MPQTHQENLDEKIATICQALKNGKTIIVRDDDDREGEGDLIASASSIGESALAFMIRHTSGIICAPLTSGRAKTLGLYEMVPSQHNDAPHKTAFTISVDAKKGTTTGISAKERLATLRLLADPKASVDDFVKPGHVFPLIAKAGGVLTRAGHTEAAVDLMVLAGLPDIGVIGELVNDDGSVKQGQDIHQFAKDHQLLTITIDELIAYRQGREQLLSPLPIEATRLMIDGKKIPTKICPYRNILDDVIHHAILLGDNPIDEKKPILTRLHVENPPYDILPIADKNYHLAPALSLLKEEDPALLIYLKRGAVGVGEGHLSALERSAIWREVGIGAQILRHLGVTKIKLLAHHEKQYLGLSGFGLMIESFQLF